MNIKCLNRIRWILGVSIKLIKFSIGNPKGIIPAISYLVNWRRDIAEGIKRAANLEEAKRSLDERVLCPKAEDRWFNLYKIVRNLKPDVVVETGVAAGESTSYILQALEDNGVGKLYSIDLPNQFYLTSNNIFHGEFSPLGKGSGYLVPERLKHRWNLTLGDTYNELPKLFKKIQEVNLFLHDSKHTYEVQKFEMECAWPSIKVGGFLIVDDADWSYAFEEFCNLKKAKGTIQNGQGIIQKPSTTN